MVGVPGKSKGCLTCRRRKIRCDEGRPTCANCKKSNRTCEGYVREKKFISHYEKETRQQSSNASSSKDPHGALEPGSEQESASAYSIASQQNNLPTSASHAGSFDTQFFSMFMDAMCSSEPDSIQNAGRWLPATFQISQHGSPLLALRALCVTRVGRIREDQRLVAYGRWCYGQALRSLQADLYDRNKAHTLQTSSTCRILSIYELFDSVVNGVGGWSTHVQGFAKVIEGGGPKLFKPALDEGILVSCRKIFVVWSVVGRRALFLSEPAWYPSESSPYFLEENLFHQGLRLGAIFWRLDQSLKPTERLAIPSASTAAQCVRDLASLEEELVGWFASYQFSVGDYQLYWPDEAFAEPEVSKLYGFRFRKLAEAIMILTYWSLRLMLNMNMAKICKELPSIISRQRVDEQGVELDSVFPQLLIDRFASFHGAEKRIELANNIVRAMPYLIREKVGLESLQGGMFPTAVALQELTNHDKMTTEYRRGSLAYKHIMTRISAAADWLSGREYLVDKNRPAGGLTMPLQLHPSERARDVQDM